ncbi:MAG: BACON domain-containing protein [Ktedonobacteraceae bacterium]
MKRRSAFDTLPDRALYQENTVDPNATEFCPCIGETGTPEDDLWADATDPFLVRSRPNAAEAAHIEAADIQRVQLEERPTLRYPTIPPIRRHFSIWRLIIGSAMILALSALLIDGLLLSVAFRTLKRPATAQGVSPTLTLSTGLAKAGQAISVQLAHFAPLSHVVLTHDVQHALLTTTNTASLAVDANGQAATRFVVGRSWRGGSHLIVAEDAVAHETASALLRVINANFSHSASSEPAMTISPLHLNFSAIQVQANPGGRVFTILNNGGGVLKWTSTISSSATTWLTVTPSSGSVPPNSTSQVTVNLTTTYLTPGTYTGQIVMNGSNSHHLPAADSPQVLLVSLLVQPACSLAQPSTNALLFDGSANSPPPAAQTVTLMATGSCLWPLHWAASVSPVAPWLTLTPVSGSLASSSQEDTITASVHTNDLTPGTYNTSLKISVIDAKGVPVYDSSQTVTVTLTIPQACTLQLLPRELAFSAVQGTAPTSQTLAVNTVGSCSGSIAWTASTDPSSSAWLSLSTRAGNSENTLIVTVIPGDLPPHIYTGQIILSARSNGTALQDSPYSLSVTFTITGQEKSVSPGING